MKDGFEEEFLQRYFKPPFNEVQEMLSCIDVTAPFGSALSAPPSVLAKFIDFDRFNSMAATEVLCGHWDGYTFNKNNYRFYFDSESGKWVFFVHAMNSIFGSPAPEYGLYPEPRGIVAKQLYTAPAFKARLDARIREIFAENFDLERITNRVREIAKPIAEDIGGHEGRDELARYDERIDRLVQHIAKRWHEVDRELE